MYEKQYHIALHREQGARYVLLPGDPGRVEAIAKQLDDARFVTANREFVTWSGNLSGERVLVTSTGIGGPSASIAVEELVKTGAHTFLRVGTCGGMQTQVLGGQLVIPTGAIRMEGTTREYVPVEFPAVPAYGLVQALCEEALELGCVAHTGVTQSKDSFYGQHDPGSMPVGAALKENWQAWIAMGCLASEMECAAVFITAMARGARAGAVLLTVWNQEREKAGMDNIPQFDTAAAIQTAVGAMRRIIESDRAANPDRG